MKTLIDEIRTCTEVKTAHYFLFSIMEPYYVLLPNLKEEEAYFEKISPALKVIEKKLNDQNIDRQEVFNLLSQEEPYLEYLARETEYDINYILLKLITKYSFDLFNIFDLSLEQFPREAHSRYKITEIIDDGSANHQGIYFNGYFYFYSPFFSCEVDATQPPLLIQQLFLEKQNANRIFIRLDATLSVKEEKYKPSFTLLHELHNGKIIDLDNIKLNFPIQLGTHSMLCVYNPVTMKKIQFKISNRNDSELWIEVEEIFPINEANELYTTKYLHSIYNPVDNCFEHIDGSFNFYKKNTYEKSRYKTQINAHADGHEKFWLVEGKISILGWTKLMLIFFDDYDLMFDALNGQLVEEIFDI